MHFEVGAITHLQRVSAVKMAKSFRCGRCVLFGVLMLGAAPIIFLFLTVFFLDGGGG